jgi:hypothetical protein
MPYLRVATWNANGEKDQRPGRLQEVIVEINRLTSGQSPQVQVIAIQEATQGGDGEINKLLDNHAGLRAAADTADAAAATAAAAAAAPGALPGAQAHAQALAQARDQAQTAATNATFSNFTHNSISEHDITQTYRVGHSNGYIVAQRTRGASPVTCVQPPANLIYGGNGPLYRIDFGQDAGIQNACQGSTTLRQLSDNCRWPVFRCFTVIDGGATANVVFITVHLEQKKHWLGIANNDAKPWRHGLRQCLLLLGSSAWLANARTWVANNGLIVIAGDLNAYESEIGTVLRDFKGRTNNLSHILAWSPSRVRWSNDFDFESGDDANGRPLSPHGILTAALQW